MLFRSLSQPEDRSRGGRSVRSALAELTRPSVTKAHGRRAMTGATCVLRHVALTCPAGYCARGGRLRSGAVARCMNATGSNWPRATPDSPRFCFRPRWWRCLRRSVASTAGRAAARLAGLGAAADRSPCLPSIGMVIRISRSMSRRSETSSRSQSEIATPSVPARAVRPIRCT